MCEIEEENKCTNENDKEIFFCEWRFFFPTRKLLWFGLRVFGITRT